MTTTRIRHAFRAVSRPASRLLIFIPLAVLSAILSTWDSGSRAETIRTPRSGSANLDSIGRVTIAWATHTDPSAVEPAVIDRLIVEVARLAASDAIEDAELGISTALEGDTLVVGADIAGYPVNLMGQAYIYDQNATDPGNLAESAILRASDFASGDRFGISVAISGDVVVVGAYREEETPATHDYGAAYVFERNAGGSGNWGQVKKLTSAFREDFDQFGISVAVSGDTVVVGSFLDNNSPAGTLANSGAAYVYERDSGGIGNWGEVKKLTAGDAQELDFFGISVAIEADTIAVGATGEDGGPGNPYPDSGSVYVFGRDWGGTDNWGEVRKLQAGDPHSGDRLGNALAIDGETLVAGAYFEGGVFGDPLFQSGAAYLFERDEGGLNNWGQIAKLKAGDPEGYDRFGTSVAVDGDAVVVGAPNKDGNVDTGDDSGAVYVFLRDQGGADQWGEADKLAASDGQAGDRFGVSVAVSGSTLAAGAYLEDGGEGDPLANSGAVYVYEGVSVIFTEFLFIPIATR